MVFIKTVLILFGFAFLCTRLLQVYKNFLKFDSLQSWLKFLYYFIPSSPRQVNVFSASSWLAILKNHAVYLFSTIIGRISHFITNWILSTNHRRIAVMYFVFTIITGFTGLILATVIRIELAYAGQGILAGNAEKYLTVVSLHGIIMVFFVVIPILFGAFGNFLLPTQLGIRDVAFPRLNSFMFWITPSGFVLLLHILLFDKSYNLTYWLNYSELKSQLRRRYQTVSAQDVSYHLDTESTLLGLRLATNARSSDNLRHQLLSTESPKVKSNSTAGFSGSAADLISTCHDAVARLFDLAHLSFAVESLFLNINLFVAQVASYLGTSLRCGFYLGEYMAFLLFYCDFYTLDFALASIRQLPYTLVSTSRALGYSSYNWFFAATLLQHGGITPDRDTRTLPSTMSLHAVIESLSHSSYNWYIAYQLLQSSGIVTAPVSFSLTPVLAVFTPVTTSRTGLIADIFATVEYFSRFDYNWFFAHMLLRDSGLAVWCMTQAHSFTLRNPLSGLSIYAFLDQGRVGGEFHSTVLQAHGASKSLHVSASTPSAATSQYFLSQDFTAVSLSTFGASAIRRDYPMSAFYGLTISSGNSSVFSNFGLTATADVNFTDSFTGVSFVEIVDLFCLSILTLNPMPLYSTMLVLFAETNLVSELFSEFLYQIVAHRMSSSAAILRSCSTLNTPVATPAAVISENFFDKPVYSFAAILAESDYSIRGVFANFSSAVTTRLNTDVTQDVTLFGVYNLALADNTSCFGVSATTGAALLATRTYLTQYYYILGCFDYLNDWRQLKLERELWRSIDDLSTARKHWLLRKRYYANFYAPASLINKVSIWMPNHIIPGWAFVTPYTSRLRYTAVGKVDVALIVVLMASVGSVFSSVNYVITYRYIGAPILKNRKELRSFYVDALLVGSRMMIVANPALIIGILLLLSDRHFNTSVFDFSGGGDTILFQHLFWFFGHPEVYIIIIPCFGFMNSLLPYYLRKRLSGRLSLQFSMYTIAFMSFAVWGHHMYMVGLANSVRTLYSTGTVMISVPASTKILHWCVTLIQSSLSCDVGFLFLLCFMYFFVLGGLSGMFVAHIGFDVIFHDTFYVIGHFHVMFACAAMCCIFAGFYFYFASIFGVRYSRFFAYLHFVFFVVGQLITIIPMMWLGYAGMPRRIMDYPAAFAGWHSIISSGHLLIVLSFIFFFCMIFDSLYENRAPISKTKGVSRLNTRLGFYAYEMRKLKYSRSKSQNLLKRCFSRKGDNANVYHLCYTAELANFEYIFDVK